jgi:hypothetical protein
VFAAGASYHIYARVTRREGIFVEPQEAEAGYHVFEDFRLQFQSQSQLGASFLFDVRPSSCLAMWWCCSGTAARVWV